MSNKVEERFNGIIDAVCYWLGYQFKIGRAQLIHEASLRYPIADTITAKGTRINRIVLEKLHPIFKSKKIDLVIFDETVADAETEVNDDKLVEVYEFKLAKVKTAEEKSDEHQRVFDDVVRLAYYNKWKGKDCYFLMCGTYEEFKTFFVGQKPKVISQNHKNTVMPIVSKQTKKPLNHSEDEWMVDGLYKDWFEFKTGLSKTIKFEIDKKNKKEKWGLKDFKKNYILRDKVKHKYSNEITIKTTCMAITPPGEKNRTHAAGIWKIEAA